MTPEDRPVKTPLEEIKKASLEHYEKLADAAHCWNNFIPKAIEAYNPEAIEQYLKWLDERILAAKTRDAWDDSAGAVLSELEDAKYKFLSLIQ